MKISDLEENLKSIRESHGDLDIGIVDADTCWVLALSDDGVMVESDGHKTWLELSVDYGDEHLVV